VFDKFKNPEELFSRVYFYNSNPKRRANFSNIHKAILNEVKNPELQMNMIFTFLGDLVSRDYLEELDSSMDTFREIKADAKSKSPWVCKIAKLFVSYEKHPLLDYILEEYGDQINSKDASRLFSETMEMYRDPLLGTMLRRRLGDKINKKTLKKYKKAISEA